MGWRPRLFVYALFLVSGAMGLVYQVSWVRDLSLVFGASHQAISIVLASFMAGLSLGGLAFGRRVFQRFAPLRLYGLLEIAVALCAALLPFFYRLVDLVYVAIALRTDGVTAGLTVWRIGMAFTALLLPTFFMGGTLPVLTRFLVQRYGDFAVRVSSLYGINTVGAILGVLLANFVLLPGIGVRRTQLTAAAINVWIGVMALLVYRQLTRATRAVPRSRRVRSGRRWKQLVPQTRVVHPNATPVEPPSAAPTAERRLTALRLAFWGTGIGGFAALGLEVMWSRGISIASGTSIYSFAVMLAAFLSGIALGSGLHAVLPLRRVHESLQFALAFLGAGISSTIVTRWIPRLPELALAWNRHLYGDGPAVGTKTALFMAFAIMLVPCTFMGWAFPVSGQAQARLGRDFGRSIGDTVALNTGGAILGSLLAGFVLIPSVGLQRGMLLLATAYIAYGLLVLAFAVDFRRPEVRWAARGATLAAVVPAILIPLHTRTWDLQLLGTFRNHNLASYVDAGGRNVLRDQLGRAELLYYEEGRGSTVSVYELDDRRSLVVNGKGVAGDVLTDLHHELLLGHLPVLLHPHPRSAIVVGLGAGITLGGVAAYDEIEDIDLVEIEPAVYGAAAQFDDVNDGALHDPRVHVHEQDGRNFLLTTRATYDIITADPIHPWAQGAAYLFTTEYYRMLARHLEPGGIMCQWFPLYDFSDRDIRSVAATFAASFPYATLWQTTFDAILIGSNAPITVDAAELARRMQEPRVARQLRWIGLEKPLSLLTEFAMDDATLRSFAANGILNTDDNLYIEFSSPWSLVHYRWLDNLPLVRAQRSSPLAIVRNPGALDPDPTSLRQRIEAEARAKTETVAAAVAIHDGNPADVQAAAVRLSEIARALPDYGLPRRFACHAWARVASRRWGAGDAAGAVDAARHALALCPDDAEAHRQLGLALDASGSPADAAVELRESLRLRPRHLGTRTALSTLLVGLGADAEVVRLLRDGCKMVPGNAELATRLAWRLATLPDPDVRNGTEALRCAEAALALPIPQNRRATTLAALAAAQAELGRFGDATTTARSALDLAQQEGQEVTTRLLRSCLTSFQEGRPFRHGVDPAVATGVGTVQQP